MLDAMTPAFAAAEASIGPQRLIAIQTNQGILAQVLFPRRRRPRLQGFTLLAILDKFRDRMTVFSGVSHPEVDGGHEAEQCFLTAAPIREWAGFAIRSRSINTPPNGSDT